MSILKYDLTEKLIAGLRIFSIWMIVGSLLRDRWKQYYLYVQLGDDSIHGD